MLIAGAATRDASAATRVGWKITDWKITALKKRSVHAGSEHSVVFLLGLASVLTMRAIIQGISVQQD